MGVSAHAYILKSHPTSCDKVVVSWPTILPTPKRPGFLLAGLFMYVIERGWNSLFNIRMLIVCILCSDKHNHIEYVQAQLDYNIMTGVGER